MDQSLIIIDANEPFDASAFTRWSLGVAVYFGLSFAILSALLLYYIKRQTDGTDKVLNTDENYFLFNWGPTIKVWGPVILVISALLALATGISWIVLTLQRPPEVKFYAQGINFYTPSTWNFDASATNLADVKEIRFIFGDGQYITSKTANASHTYMLTGPVDTDQTIKMCVEITTRHNEKASNCLTLNLRNGFPQPKLTCRITTSIKYAYAPLNVSCDASSSFTRYPGRNITRWRINWGQCFGQQGFVELKKPYVMDHLVERPGDCRIALEVGDNTGLFSVTPATFDLKIPDGSPILNLDINFVDNPFESAPVDVRFDISRSQLVYPDAQWRFVEFVLPPNKKTVHFNIPPGFGGKLPANVSSILSHIDKPDEYVITVTIGDTTGRTRTYTKSFTVHSSDPIADLKYKTEHNGYTLERLLFDCIGSHVMYPKRYIDRCEWSSPDLDAVDGKVTKPPIWTVSSGQKMLDEPSTYRATVVVVDSAGQKSKPVTVRVQVKSGKARAKCTASYDYFWSRCDRSYYDFYAKESVDPSGHTLQKYKWFQDGWLQSTQTKNTWSDSYMRFSWSRDIRISLVVVTDQNLESDPYDIQLNIAKDDCKTESGTEIRHTMGLRDIGFVNLVSGPFNQTDLERNIEGEFRQHGAIESIVVGLNDVILTYQKAEGAKKAIEYLAERIDLKDIKMTIKG